MALIWNNVIIPCAAHVIDWRSSGMEFTKANENCGERKRAPELFIIHYTGAENPPSAMYRNMLKAGKAVEFGMDYHGQIWQFCDPAKVFTAHAAGANPFSFGMEIQSRGTPQREPNAAFPRGTYVDKMDWGTQRYVHFTADQLDALCDFIDALTTVDAIPRKLAMSKLDIRKRIPKSEWPLRKGVGGHYHFDLQDNTAKIDPGPQVFDELYEHFQGVRVKRKR